MSRRIGTRQKFTLIDETTGDYVTKVLYGKDSSNQLFKAFDGHCDKLDRIDRKVGRTNEKAWMKLAMSTMAEAVDGCQHNAKYMFVLCKMLSKIAYGGRIKLSINQIIDETNCGKQTVYDAINHFIEQGYILRGTNEGKPAFYLSEKLGTRGYSEMESKARRDKKIKGNLTVYEGGKSNAKGKQ